MPIPLILGFAGVLTGAYGIKKSFDAKSDFNDADTTNEQAKQIYDAAMYKLEITRGKTQASLSELGELKFNLYKNSLVPFVTAFKKIHGINFQHDAINDKLQLKVDYADMTDIENTTLKMTNLLSGGIVSLGTGGIVGLAAYGSVGALASTVGGTAIGGLSGVAATNATLAWLGGGALSTGGFGVVGGTYVLGSIVAGPILAIGGMMLASKAEEAKQNAYSNLNSARIAAEQMKTADISAQGVHTRIKEIHQILEKFEDIFQPLLGSLQNLVAHSPKNWLGKLDYMQLSNKDQVGIMVSMMVAKTIKNILETPLLDKKGVITEASGTVIHKANNNLREIQECLT